MYPVAKYQMCLVPPWFEEGSERQGRPRVSTGSQVRLLAVSPWKVTAQLGLLGGTSSHPRLAGLGNQQAQAEGRPSAGRVNAGGDLCRVSQSRVMLQLCPAKRGSNFCTCVSPRLPLNNKSAFRKL